MKPKQIISLATAAILAGCSPAELPGSEETDGYMILAENGEAIVQLRDGSSPVVSFFIVRAPSDALVSRRWEVNGKPRDLTDTAELGRTWDRDDIIPEGVEDSFSALVPDTGEITVRLVASYKSGKVYVPEVNYRY